MLAVAFDLQILAGEEAQVASENRGILEVLITAFCRNLVKQVRLGLVRQYKGLEENFPVVRERINVRKALSLEFMPSRSGALRVRRVPRKQCN